MEDNRSINSHQSYDIRQILDTSVQRSFTILPIIYHRDNLHEDAVIIWLDDTIGISVESKWFNIAPQLRQIINHVEVFTNVQKCIEYIGAIGIEQVFLIVTGTYGDNFDARLFEEITNNVFIYVLTTDKLEHIGNHIGIRGYFDNVKTLIDKINDDYMVYTSNTASDINFIGINTSGSTTRCINPQLIRWKCLQLMFDILRRMPCPREQSKDRFIQLCTSYYIENPSELEYLREFEETYRPCDAISWYTKECFLYRLLNQSFRVNNIDLIMNFSFVTMDIHDKLYELRYQQHDLMSSIVVYRGQLMGIDELQNLKLNVGGFISNNTLWSTDINHEVAIMYSGTGAVDDTRVVSVLIEISIDMNSHISKPFADLSSLSAFSGSETEVLFMYGNVFRIDSFELTAENSWRFKLTLCDNLCSTVKNLSDYFDVAILQLFEILPKISPKTNKANDRMLQWWRLYCNGDPTELAKINQFEESYRSDSAIRWYTKDSILCRLLNTALRHENIDMIVDFSCFIIDLYDQLTKSHMDYVRSSMSRI